MKQLLVAAVITTLTSMTTLPLAAEADCESTKILRHTFDADAFESLSMNALAGRLDIVGGNGDSIVFEGRACTDRDRWLDDMTLLIGDAGRELELTASIPEHGRGFEPRYAYMDIEIELPRYLPIRVRDSSGDILIRGAHVTGVDDSSGSIRIEDATASPAPLDIRDSSGDVDLRRIDGDVVIRDSSGSLSLRNITGNLEIPSDSSGDIQIDDIGGSVEITRDSSGEIEIENVAMNVGIGSDGSGAIEIRDIGGSVTIGSDGSGLVRVSGVRGDFTLSSKGSGDIRIRDVEGRVSTPR